MKKILELRGWKVVAEDKESWTLEPTEYDGPLTPGPIILPKRGPILALDVQMETLIKTKTDLQAYFTLKEQVMKNAGISPGNVPEDHPLKLSSPSPVS
jgi:hypothetical protein